VDRIKKLNLGLFGALLITLASLTGCVPPEGAEGGFDWTIIVFLVVIFGIFYLLLIRPQRKRQKEHQQLITELKRGDRVITAGGIYGVIENLSEDSVVIKVESGTTMRVARNSIALRRDQ
jgi:preprotein translocase subunit YajC